MKTSLKRIHAEDGLELVGLLYEPDQVTKKILVHVHGMAGNFYENKFLDYIAETLTKSGVAFFTFNNRGCEMVKDLHKLENGERKMVRIGNAHEIFEDSKMDIQAAIDFVKTTGFDEIHLSGHSLGSPKVAYYAAENGNLKSVIFLSPADMVGLFVADKNFKRDMALARKMIDEGKGDELIPFPVLWDDSQLSAKTYISLGSSDSKVAIFSLHDPKDPLTVLSKIRVPTLSLMGMKDDAQLVPIEEALEKITKALTNSPKAESYILGDADHGYNGYEQQLADELLKWIQKN